MEIPSGKTFLIDGPVAVKVVTGNASVFGCRLKPRKIYIMRPWKRYPVFAETDVKLEINLGAEAKTELVDQDTVSAWRQSLDKFSGHRVLAVCGRVDSGKTSFATFIANNLVEKHGECVVVSLDPGQSYFTPPSVVGLAKMNEPVHDLAVLTPVFQRPVGSTSAASSAYEVLEAAQEIASILPSVGPIVIDVDGWVDGPAALAHKNLILKSLGCRSAVVLGEEAELVNALQQSGVDVYSVPASNYARQRDQAERKRTREWLYRKFLGKPRLRLIPTSWVEVYTLDRKTEPRELLKQVVNALVKPADNGLDEANDPETFLTRKRIGILCYLYDSLSRYVGIGVFTGINLDKKIVYVSTAVDSEFKKVLLGRVVVSEQGDEILLLD